MRHILSISIFIFFLVLGCGEGAKKSETKSEAVVTSERVASPAPEYDPNRGEGKWNSENVTLGATLDPTMAIGGEKIYTVKCSSCHKLSNEKLVGPGWKGVTSRRRPEWIMNFITN